MSESNSADQTDRIDSLETRLQEAEDRIKKIERRIDEGDVAEETTGLRDLVQRFGPETHTERALAIAYHLDRHQGQDNFTVADVNDGYRTIRSQKPANMSDVLSQVEGKGWIMDDGKDSRTRLWRLTNDGLSEVEEVIHDGA